jgi:hypothetical protein
LNEGAEFGQVLYEEFDEGTNIVVLSNKDAEVAIFRLTEKTTTNLYVITTNIGSICVPNR